VVTSKKHFNDTFEDRIRDLPACSSVREPIAPPRACPPPTIYSMGGEMSYLFSVLLFSDEHFLISWFIIFALILPIRPALR